MANTRATLIRIDSDGSRTGTPEPPWEATLQTIQFHPCADRFELVGDRDGRGLFVGRVFPRPRTDNR